MKSRLVQFALVILAACIFGFVTMPAYRAAQDLRQRASDNSQTLALSAQLKKNRQDLTDRYNRITDGEREGLARLLPDTIDNVRLVNTINDIAKSKGLTIRGTTVGDDSSGKATTGQSAAADAAARKQRYGTLTLSFNTTASYTDFSDFLRELERSLRLVDVRSITIKSSPTRKYEFSVTMQTYWLR